MNRIKELDGLRGIAILLVLVWHYFTIQIQPGGSAPLGYLVKFLSLTWSGVDLFFVLSGFFIIGILVDAKGSPTYFRTFYIRRICRILPLYYLMVGLFILLPRMGLFQNDWLFAEELPLWSYLTLTQNFFMHDQGFGPNWLGVTWSLAIEEQFYLFIPLLVWSLSRRKLVWFFVMAILLAPVLRQYFGNLGAYVFPFTRADSILMGGLIALLIRSRKIWLAYRVHYRGLVVLAGICLLGLVSLVVRNAGVGDVYLHFLLGLFYSVVVVLTLASRDKNLNVFLSNRVLVWLGLRSYGIYLFHQPVSSLVNQVMKGSPTPTLERFSDLGTTAVALILVVVLSEISYRYFESYFLRIGRKFRLESPVKN